MRNEEYQIGTIIKHRHYKNCVGIIKKELKNEKGEASIVIQWILRGDDRMPKNNEDLYLQERYPNLLLHYYLDILI